jgi:hypothetical protein
MLVDWQWGEQDDSRIMSHYQRMGNYFLDVGLVFFERNVLLVWSVRQRCIVCPEEDSLVVAVSTSSPYVYKILPGSGF